MGVKNVLDKVLALFKKGDNGIFSEEKGKKFNLLIMIGAFGVILIILANSFGGPKPEVQISTEDTTKNSTADAGSSANKNGVEDIEQLIAGRLEEILAQIDGVGKVKVTVNLASTMEYEYAINTSTNNRTTEERDQKGGNRTISEINEDGELVLIKEGDGAKETPVVKKEIKPQVQGVVVVAEGAGLPEIKAQLLEAVQVYLNVSPHKVVVLPKEAGE